MIYWLALSLASAAVTSLAIWSRFPTRARMLSVLAFLATMPVMGAILVLNAGWAVSPIRYLSELPADGEILGLKLEQDVAIYLMLDVDGEPRVFKLPWSNLQASKLQRLMEGQAGGGGPIHAKRGQKSDGSDATFHEQPQPPAPEKQAEQSGLNYQRQGS